MKIITRVKEEFRKPMSQENNRQFWAFIVVILLALVVAAGHLFILLSQIYLK